MALKFKSLPTVTMTGSPVRLTTVSTLAIAVVFQAPEANAGAIVAETDSAVSTAAGAQIAAGKEIAIGPFVIDGAAEAFDLADFYFDGTNADTLNISYIPQVV